MDQIKQLSVPPNKIGQATGPIATYRAAPKMDVNFIAKEKGVGDLTQHGFNKQLGI